MVWKNKQRENQQALPQQDAGERLREYGQLPEPYLLGVIRGHRELPHFEMEDTTPLWRGLVIGFSILLLLASGHLVFRHVINERFLSAYRSGKYDTMALEPALVLNFPQGYVLYYNEGNAYYQTEDFDKAAASYQKALDALIPEGKECPVRINLTLALLRQIDYAQMEEALVVLERAEINTETEQAAAQKVIDLTVNQLLAARQVLCAQGCAEEEGEEGHSKEAVQLRNEIDALLQRLSSHSSGDENAPQQEPEEEDNDESETQDQQKSQREQRIENQLRQQQKESGKERAQSQRDQDLSDYLDEFGDDGGDFEGKTW